MQAQFRPSPKIKIYQIDPINQPTKQPIKRPIINCNCHSIIQQQQQHTQQMATINKN